jgi:predicted ArsR family transcriptional regulator
MNTQRQNIYILLQKGLRYTAGEIADALHMPRPSVRRCLQELQRAGRVQSSWSDCRLVVEYHA